jgi:hypothetical protein
MHLNKLERLLIPVHYTLVFLKARPEPTQVELLTGLHYKGRLQAPNLAHPI